MCDLWWFLCHKLACVEEVWKWANAAEQNGNYSGKFSLFPALWVSSECSEWKGSAGITRCSVLLSISRDFGQKNWVIIQHPLNLYVVIIILRSWICYILFKFALFQIQGFAWLVLSVICIVFYYIPTQVYLKFEITDQTPYTDLLTFCLYENFLSK